jgi:hypothetical protein
VSKDNDGALTMVKRVRNMTADVVIQHAAWALRHSPGVLRFHI